MIFYAPDALLCLFKDDLHIHEQSQQPSLRRRDRRQQQSLVPGHPPVHGHGSEWSAGRAAVAAGTDLVPLRLRRRRWRGSRVLIYETQVPRRPAARDAAGLAVFRPPATVFRVSAFCVFSTLRICLYVYIICLPLLLNDMHD